jgi:uncharacterized protein YjbI with pentapeptide repeats
VALEATSLCFAHAPARAREGALDALRQGGELGFTRGLRLTTEMLSEILAAAASGLDRRALRAADFTDAVFEGAASFDSVTFERMTTFGNATFAAAALFHGAAFGQVSFADATFTGGAAFTDATFHEATFVGARFESNVEFQGAVFAGPASFAGAKIMRGGFSAARFEGSASFRNGHLQGCDFYRSQFEQVADFEQATVEKTSFGHARFDGHVRFRGTSLREKISFADATFGGTGDFRGLSVSGALDLTDVAFLQPTDIEIRGGQAVLTRVEFAEGAQLTVVGTDLALEQAEFRQPTIVTGEQGARLLSLRRANVANLVLTGLDLSACRFVKAHNLDRLRLEGDITFAPAPKARHLHGRGSLAEEHQLRAARRHQLFRRPWFPERCRLPEWFAKRDDLLNRPLEPRYVSNVYRDLRKGREDAKDEPGAADFYYGEMEMRRLDRERPWAERTALTLYWLVSGYGLRATRALAALVATVLVFAGLLYWIGFEPRQDFTRALLFSAESTSNLFRTPETPKFALTEWGEAMQIPLRLLGPLFFGLTILSLRGRVKR